jgi:hypothetical protein
MLLEKAQRRRQRLMTDFDQAEQHDRKRRAADREYVDNAQKVRPISSSRRPRSSGTRPPHPTSFGRPTSPISRSSAGDGCTCPRSSTTSRATSSPGSCARRCAATTSPRRSNRPSKHQAAIAPGSRSDPAVERQRTELHRRRPGGSRIGARVIPAARPSILRPRARSSAGVRRSRTASC